MSESQSSSDIYAMEVREVSNDSNGMKSDLLTLQSNMSITTNNLSELVEKSPNEIILFIIREKYNLISFIEEDTSELDTKSYTIIAIGKACMSEDATVLNKLFIKISSSVQKILVGIQKYLISLRKLESSVKKFHLDSLFYLTVFLRNFQLALPSSSLDFISMLLPLLKSTTKRFLAYDEELCKTIAENLNEVDNELTHFLKHYSAFELKNAAEKEELHLLEPPENFRSLSVMPTLDDIHLPCSFLRPNIAKGKYRNVEHYLDVQFRLLKEDYTIPLRNGIAEYLCLKKENKSFKNLKNVRVYSNASIVDEEFVKGSLVHTIKFNGENFSAVNWETSKRFLTGSLLCFSSDDFQSMLFATVLFRDLKYLKEGLLCVHFEEDDIFNLDKSTNFVVIETTTYFESYRHNLKALQTLNEEFLPMKRYIIDVDRSINHPQYLLPTMTYDMRPLLIPLEKKYIRPLWRRSFQTAEYEYPNNCIKTAEPVIVRDDSNWPSASELKLDQSQFNALKLAVTKEFAVIQGPPGTGKTYVGLRVVQLLLHNISRWFNTRKNSLPILIVCYTNHALDQFLEGVTLFTKNIVRIGGRGTNEKIAEFQISELRDKSPWLKSHVLKSMIIKLKEEIEGLMKKIDAINNSLESSTKYLLRQSDLNSCLSRVHLESLQRGDFRLQHELRSKRNTIEDWLEIKSLDETSCKVEILHDNANNFVSGINEEVDGEGEGDIDFIENQRNIDVYKFEDHKLLAKLQLKKNKVENKKNYVKHIKERLKRCKAMKDHEAMKIKNIWRLHLNARWKLYKFWLEIFAENQQKKFFNLQTQLKTASKNLSDLYAKQDIHIIGSSHVVGMTTTGAAKYRHIIEALKPAILIVEEAAEILESHIITSLTPETQHVILIGDQQQLRPSPAVFELAVKYNMNISLFERLIKNGIDYCRLSLQHRMRPEIAALIVPHIYRDLKNHEVVTKFENIKGVDKNVYFITHNISELHVKDSKSKVNEHEAKFLVKLCNYFILQGYEPSQITVLTTYSGQLFTLKRLATDKVKNVRFTVVDNFQGEENDIILISFVRSNDEGNVGFLKVSNRICVALSRAKKGLFCIGNFELLAQKSSLWKNIVETLKQSKSIGITLCLKCSNHPDVSNLVAGDADFAAVPEGGCSQKCNYRLHCGHMCPLLCHSYDRDHIDIICKKPCVKVCENGHNCAKMCSEDCRPCPVLVDKTLSRCGHVINTLCGLSESKIRCFESCTKVCKKGHLCPKKCYEDCGSCPVIVDRTLTRCGHTIKAPCGAREFEIKCDEPCSKSCSKGHKCPKKCFEKCGHCKVLVDRTLKRCGHVINTLCGIHEEEIKCLESCSKICKRGHPCSKNCFENCDCPVIVDRTLTRCGHTIKAPCGANEFEIRCNEPCAKTCNKGHKCSKKCFEWCGPCEVLVDRILKRCGHTVKSQCGKSTMFDFSIKCENQCTKFCAEGHQCAKKCHEICGLCRFLVSKTLTLCGHTVKIPCYRKDNTTGIKCTEKCNKVLSCGHECTNKCFETCVVKCVEKTEILSPVCGHTMEVTCGFVESFEELQKMCSKPCKKVLPCGHTCKGTCSTCFQERLHIKCEETCGKTLICGHKCEAKCGRSCPPCGKPCENWCSHGKCRRKCSSLCLKCFKKCDWQCPHEKCSRICDEVCDRKPCNEPCTKKFSCNHICVGFCGEPCPELCQICLGTIPSKDLAPLESKGDSDNYIYLEDCKHLFTESDLRKWFSSRTEDLFKIEMKSCPKCNAVIRRNVRFNKIIKSCIANFEQIKLIAMYNRVDNLTIQRSLLRHPKLSYIHNNDSYKPLIKVLKSENPRNIQDIFTIGNLINIAANIESLQFNVFTMFICEPSLESLLSFARFSREWLNKFICDNILCVSEYQLQQLSDEIYRLNLVDLLLKIASQKDFVTSSPDFEKCKEYILNFKPFKEDDIKNFKATFQNLANNFGSVNRDLPEKDIHNLTTLTWSGNWYQCINGHIKCVVTTGDIVNNICYECKKNEISNGNRDCLSTSYYGYECKPLHCNEEDSQRNLISESLKSTSKIIEHKQIDSIISADAKGQKDLSTSQQFQSSSDEIEMFRTERNKNIDSMAFLSSLFLKKLSITQKEKCFNKANYNLCHNSTTNQVSTHSDTMAKNASFIPQKPNCSRLKIEKTSSQKSIKFDKMNLSKDLSVTTVQKSVTNKKMDEKYPNQAKATGTIPKYSKPCFNFRHENYKQNKLHNTYHDDLPVLESNGEDKYSNKKFDRKRNKYPSNFENTPKDLERPNNRPHLKGQITRSETQNSADRVNIPSRFKKHANDPKERKESNEKSYRFRQKNSRAIETNFELASNHAELGRKKFEPQNPVQDSFQEQCLGTLENNKSLKVNSKKENKIKVGDGTLQN